MPLIKLRRNGRHEVNGLGGHSRLSYRDTQALCSMIYGPVKGVVNAEVWRAGLKQVRIYQKMHHHKSGPCVHELGSI